VFDDDCYQSSQNRDDHNQNSQGGQEDRRCGPYAGVIPAITRERRLKCF
jgi:hypothetical protein